MSEPTRPAPTSRPPVVPIVLGLLLVAAVIVVALLIESATDNDVDLPDELSGGLRADRAQPVAAGVAERDLEETLDETVTLRTYRDGSGERDVTITVVEAPAGPFAPNGPQPAPESVGLERGPFELVRDGDTVCQLAWGAVVPEGEEPPDQGPMGVFCQLGADGRTYWLSGRGVSADDAVEILEDVAD